MVFLVRTKKSNICHKRIEHHERRIANDIIHKITKEIVNRAIAQIHLKLAENVVKEEQERYKDCSYTRSVGQKNADRNTAFNIAYRGLGYTQSRSNRGHTHNSC